MVAEGVGYWLKEIAEWVSIKLLRNIGSVQRKDKIRKRIYQPFSNRILKGS